jgi:hypothetical protein
MPIQKPATIYAVLGFLNEYAGRQVVEGSDLVESFYANEKGKPEIFENYLKLLVEEYQLHTTIRRETWGDALETGNSFYSVELTRLIDSYYLVHGLTGKKPDGTPAYTKSKGVFSKHVGRISDAIFPENDREARLSFLIGAHQRFGQQNSFRFANAWQKMQLVIQLLKEMDCPNVVIIYPHPEKIPAVSQVAFEPTPELIDRFGLELKGYS